MIEKIEENLKCLADANRLRIIKLLEQKPMCVCELASILEITQPAVSKHLKKLKNAEIILSEQNGLWTDYSVDKKSFIFEFLDKQAFYSILGSDEIVKKDLEKAWKVDRKELCV
jgi:ArsR family transcriptional regulator